MTRRKTAIPAPPTSVLAHLAAENPALAGALTNEVDFQHLLLRITERMSMLYSAAGSRRHALLCDIQRASLHVLVGDHITGCKIFDQTVKCIRKQRSRWPAALGSRSLS